MWILLINMLIGLLTYRDYGMSQDEVGINALGQISIHAYQTLTAPKPKLFSGYAYDLMYYGPFYAMVTASITKFLTLIFPFIRAVDFWHLCYFFSFQLAVFLLYRLATRWFSNWSAITITLLFSTQPLLWGHAFINPKDIPFMAFFLASIECGLTFLDSHWKSDANKNILIMETEFFQKINASWKKISHQEKQKAIKASLIWVGFIFLLWVGFPFLDQWLRNMVRYLYETKPTNAAYTWFSLLAEHKTKISVEYYLSKTHRWLMIGYVGLTLIGLIGSGWCWLRAFGFNLHRVQAELKDLMIELPVFLSDPRLWMAALSLGLATSIRVGAPYAGILIVSLAIWRGGKKALLPSLLYLMLSGFVTYITWPALWGNPIFHFLKSLMMASHFPWEGKLLFMGQYWHADALPWNYVPTLFAIQFTEPVVMLAVIGLIWFVIKLYHQQNTELAFVILFWFVLPVLGIMIKKPPLYDNFRQILFLIPPLFLLLGFPLQWLGQKTQLIPYRYLVLLVLIMPGILGYWQLHPYEYAYYNAFIGGISGAEDRFETEYWKTSFRQAMEYLDQTAEPRSKVLIWGATFLVEEYARPDLIVQSKKGNSYQKNSGYDYVIVSYRNDKDEQIFPDSAILYTVQRQGVNFAVVKKIK
ncbi:MAG: hypothetical protein ACPL4H_07600 [Anaerolineales bacterium]